MFLFNGDTLFSVRIVMTVIDIILRIYHAVVVSLTLNCSNIMVTSDRKQKNMIISQRLHILNITLRKKNFKLR